MNEKNVTVGTLSKPEPKRKYPTAKGFGAKMKEYFDDVSNSPYLMQDLAVFMGLSNERLLGYSQYEGYSIYIARARQMVEVNIAKKALKNQYNAYMAQFVLKNMGWRDQVDLNANVTAGVTFVDDIPRNNRK